MEPVMGRCVGEEQILIIMAKEPVPGRVKTRLSPLLTPDEACELYRCFLLDTFTEMQKLKDTRIAVAFTPREAEATFHSLIPHRFLLFPQEGKDLGKRQPNAFRYLFRQGFKRVSMIGGDIPTLPHRLIREAFHILSLHEKDVILGPSTDGGYYLVGLSQLHLGIFQGISWSSAVVLKQTMERARDLNLRVGLLEQWYDVDTITDIWVLMDQLLPNSTSKETIVCQHSLAFLQRIARNFPQKFRNSG